MGMTQRDSSTTSEFEIKVQPHHIDPHSFGGRCSHGHPPPLPPPHYPLVAKKCFPWLVTTIVVSNIILFIISMYINDCPNNSNNCIGVSILGRFSFQSMHENPLLGPTSATLQKIGALEARKVVEEHELWRLATSMWLHAGVVHVVLNMIGLIFVGIRLEQEFGFVRIGLLYFLSGFGASLLSSLFVRNVVSVGASGALFGLLGAMLSELIVNCTIYENMLGSFLCLLFIILINMAVGILPHVDNFAHIGGFLTGFLLGFVLLLHPQFGWVKSGTVPPGYSAPSSKPKYKAYQYVFLVVSLTLLILGFVVGCVILYRGVDGNKYCSWCHYLSCVPTPLWHCEARCSSSQYENQLTLTCMQNQKSKFYLLDNNATTSHIQMLCVELCG